MLPETVSVIIPARGGPGSVNRCAAALRASNLSLPLDFLVVDDASPEPLAKLLDPGTACLRLDQRQGPGRARNAGARAARGTYLVFVDSDVEVSKDALRSLLQPLRDGRADLTQGRYDADAKAPDAFAAYWADFQEFKASLVPDDMIPSFSSALFACRRDRFLSTGGFWERLGPDDLCEDEEYGLRLRAAGARLLRVRTALARHHHAYTAWSYFRFQVRNSASTARLTLSLWGRGRPRSAAAPPIAGMAPSVAAPWIAASALALMGTACIPALPLFISHGKASWWLGLTLPLVLAFFAAYGRFLAFVLRGRGIARSCLAAGLAWLTSTAFGFGMILGAAAHLARPYPIGD